MLLSCCSLRHTFLGSGTEEDQVQDGMEQCYREAFGSMVKATRLAQNRRFRNWGKLTVIVEEVQDQDGMEQ